MQPVELVETRPEVAETIEDRLRVGRSRVAEDRKLAREAPILFEQPAERRLERRVGILLLRGLERPHLPLDEMLYPPEHREGTDALGRRAGFRRPRQPVTDVAHVMLDPLGAHRGGEMILAGPPRGAQQVVLIVAEQDQDRDADGDGQGDDQQQRGGDRS